MKIEALKDQIILVNEKTKNLLNGFPDSSGLETKKGMDYYIVKGVLKFQFFHAGLN